MKRRTARKRLRPLERMLSNACRLYMTRPGAGGLDDPYEPLARSVVQLQLSFLLWESTRIGLAEFRGFRADEVLVEALEATANAVHGVGTLTLERTAGGTDQVHKVPIRFRCKVPSLLKTYRGVPRPEVSLLADGRTA